MASIAAFQNGYGGETLQHRLVAWDSAGTLSSSTGIPTDKAFIPNWPC